MYILTVTEIGAKAELIEQPAPKASEKAAIVKVHYSGVSAGTEMWVATGKRLENRTVPFPAAGYQVTGEIVETGPGLEGFKPGDRVAAFCSCAHAQYVVAKQDYLHALPDNIAMDAAALFVMPSVGSHALTHAAVKAGENVLVVGQGLIGQSTAQLARLRGAYVVTSDVSPERLAISRAHCADLVLDARQGPVHEQITEQFPNGMDVVLESTGFQGLLEDAMRCVRAGGLSQGGRFVFEGWYPGSVTFDFTIPHGKQMQCFFPAFIGERPNREAVLRLMAAGSLDTASLISNHVPWRDAAAVYTKLFGAERDHFNGIVFDWS